MSVWHSRKYLFSLILSERFKTTKIIRKSLLILNCVYLWDVRMTKPSGPVYELYCVTDLSFSFLRSFLFPSPWCLTQPLDGIEADRGPRSSGIFHFYQRLNRHQEESILFWFCFVSSDLIYQRYLYKKFVIVLMMFMFLFPFRLGNGYLLQLPPPPGLFFVDNVTVSS